MPQAQAFDPKAYVQQNSAPDNAGFDPKAYLAENADVVRPKYTKTESAIRGAVQAGSMGFGDELTGAVETGIQAIKEPEKFTSLADVVKSYRANRDSTRMHNAQAQEDNPISYTGGEVAGSLATAAVPGMGAAKGASLLGKLVNAAKIGGIMGAGTSTADLTKGELGSLGEDVAGGAALGSATQGLVSGIGAVAKTITPTNVAKKAANVLMNTPEEITQTYIDNPKGVLSAPKRFELANSIEEEGLSPLKKLVTEGSKESRGILAKEGQTFSGNDIADIFKQKADQLEKSFEGVKTDPQKIAGLNWLRNAQDQFAAQGDNPLTTNRIKDEVQSIQQSVDWDIGAGRFGKIPDNVKKDVSKDINTVLKTNSPAYAEQMKQVASDAALLNDVGEVAKSPRGWANVFRKLDTDQYGAGQLPAETLKNLDTRLGTNFVDQAKLSNAREAFDKSLMNGSRNVNLFSNTLRDIPVLGKIAPLIGGTVDKYGREVTMKAVDAASKLNQFYKTEGIQKLAQEAQPFINAAKQGDPAAILTFQMLTEQNPQALKLLEKQDAMRRRMGELNGKP